MAGKARSSCAMGGAQWRRSARSATCTRWATARAAAWPIAARVPKELPTAELEGVLAGLITAVSPEPVDCAAVVYDVEEPQELGSMAHATAVKVATSCLVLSRALRLCRGSWSPGVGSSGKTRHHGPPPCISLEGFLARWGSRARSRVFIK